MISSQYNSQKLYIWSFIENRAVECRCNSCWVFHQSWTRSVWTIFNVVLAKLVCFCGQRAFCDLEIPSWVLKFLCTYDHLTGQLAQGQTSESASSRHHVWLSVEAALIIAGLSILTPRMKAPPGGTACQKFRKRYIATWRRKAVFFVLLVLQYYVFYVGYIGLWWRLGITSVCRQPVASPWIRKVFALEVDGKPPPCRLSCLDGFPSCV